VTSFELEANSIEPSAFLPQKNACIVELEKNNEVKAMSENVMGLSDSHKTKRKTAISCIGAMNPMADFSSLCINMNTIITTISSSDKPQPILLQILLDFVDIFNNTNWVRWYESVGGMPLLYWYSYSFLERVSNCFADFATVFGNGNIMSESRRITKLNTKALVRALTVMKTFCNLH
jgi:hypothetical protein